MKFHIVSLAVLLTASSSSLIEAGRLDRATELGRAPVRAATAEPGVIPSGTPLIVRTKDTVNTHRALSGTVYEAIVAENILDQHGTVLIPAGSPIELMVRSLSYLGPGGVAMTELRLDISAVTVNDVRYPVETEGEELHAGGLDLERDAAKWIGGDQTSGQVLTRGHRICVPAQTLLLFQIQDPIRLQGYRR